VSTVDAKSKKSNPKKTQKNTPLSRRNTCLKNAHTSKIWGFTPQTDGWEPEKGWPPLEKEKQNQSQSINSSVPSEFSRVFIQKTNRQSVQMIKIYVGYVDILQRKKQMIQMYLVTLL